METIDYASRKDLVEALVGFRKQGVRAEVVHNGKTLAFPDGIGATDEDEASAKAHQEAEEAEAKAAAEREAVLQEQKDAEEAAAVALQAEKEGAADGIEKTEVGGNTILGVVDEEEPMDRSTFTVEGTCSSCCAAALAEPDGSWIHAEAASHGDNDGEFVPNEPAEGEQAEGEDEAADLIGDVPAKATKRSRNRNQS